MTIQSRTRRESLKRAGAGALGLAAAPNLSIMESNYWKYAHQLPYFVSNVPVPINGQVLPPDLPGIGARIKPELFTGGDAIVDAVAKA